MKRANATELLGVIVMSLLIAVYIVFAFYRVWVLFTDGQPVSALIAIGLFVLVAVGAWALARELSFGYSSNRLAQRLDLETLFAEQKIRTDEHGKPIQNDVLRAVAEYEKTIENHPKDWSLYFFYGILLRTAGQKPAARVAIRKAIALEKQNKIASNR